MSEYSWKLLETIGQHHPSIIRDVGVSPIEFWSFWKEYIEGDDRVQRKMYVKVGRDKYNAMSKALSVILTRVEKFE